MAAGSSDVDGTIRWWYFVEKGEKKASASGAGAERAVEGGQRLFQREPRGGN